MAEYLDQLVAGLSQWHPVWAYGLLLLSAFLENVIPPVPGDAVVVFSAYLVGRGVLAGWAVYLVTCAGGTAGFLVMYYLGYTRGRHWLTGPGRSWFSPAGLSRAEAWLARYGAWLVLANRFLSGVRSVIALSAGLGRMNWRQVVLCGALSMAVWNGMLLYAGMFLGRNWDQVLAHVERYNLVVVSLLALGGGAALLLRWRRRRRDRATKKRQGWC